MSDFAAAISSDEIGFNELVFLSNWQEKTNKQLNAISTFFIKLRLNLKSERHSY